MTLILSTAAIPAAKRVSGRIHPQVLCFEKVHSPSLLLTDDLTDSVNS